MKWNSSSELKQNLNWNVVPSKRQNASQNGTVPFHTAQPEHSFLCRLQQPCRHLCVHIVHETGFHTVCRGPKQELSGCACTIWVHKVKYNSALGAQRRTGTEPRVVFSIQQARQWWMGKWAPLLTGEIWEHHSSYFSFPYCEARI